MKRNNKMGFTLVELLAVIVILALIMGIAVYSISGVLEGARADTKSESISMILNATKTTLFSKNVSLPATFNVEENGDIVLSTNSSIKVDYNHANVIGGQIYIDQAGKATAIGIIFDDNYICTMALGENGCGQGKSWLNIFDTVDSEYLKEDPDEPERRIFAGDDDTPNRIMLKENGVDVLYRIVALEKDGTIKVIRDDVLDEPVLYEASNFHIEEDEWIYTDGVRYNSKNTYCQNGYDDRYNTYDGCNAWQAVIGNYANLYNRNVAITGTVSEDSNMKTYLNSTFYNTLDENIKEKIVSHIFSVSSGTDGSPRFTITELYKRMHGINDNERMSNNLIGIKPSFMVVQSEPEQPETGDFSIYRNDVQTKIGLIEIRDYYLASSNTYGSNNTCIASDGDTESETACSESNYIYNNIPNDDYGMYTMTPLQGNAALQFGILGDGSILSYSTSTPSYVKPVFFLSSNTKLTGSGTNTDPYKLAS